MKALVAMSGGVDSSVTALLMKNMGYDVCGVMMRLYCQNGSEEETADMKDAEKIADKLGIQFEICDFRKEFEKKIIDKFVGDYEKGLTPNPCVLCNKYMKFDMLFDVADKYGCEKIATGHYARTEFDEKSGRYLLKKGILPEKDQSYVLYSLNQEKLARVILPVGCMSKEETRKIANENGFINSRKKDSQDICFIPDGDYASFIEKYTGKSYPQGDFIGPDGEILGRHKGIIRYTVGQRRGLSLSLKEPLYVLDKNIENNSVILCKNEDLYKKTVIVGDMNFIAFDNPPESFKADVRLRYHQTESPANISLIGGGKAEIEFLQPQRAPAKGQAAVFYDGDCVIGGGTIE